MGDKSKPPKFGITLRQMLSNGSVMLYKIDEVALKLPPATQLRMIVAKIE